MTTIRISRGKRGTTIHLKAGKGEDLRNVLPAFLGEPRVERWMSHAQWPLDVYRGERGDGISTDTHRTESEAQAVCAGLKRDGFGGQRKAFPVRTWVTREAA